ncbi:MAG TPA: VWA domain-containing protein [Pyrinomonadaceae bacterium]|nr:VWA domain-containing protein [Pyrinomonadaceae bacterium]
MRRANNIRHRFCHLFRRLSGLRPRASLGRRAGRGGARPLASACALVALLFVTGLTQTRTGPRPAGGRAAHDAAAGSDARQGALKQDAEGPEDEDEVIRVNTSEVLLPVTVRDADGALVTDLRREDFLVFEDNRRQILSDLALRQVPVDVALLVDSSSSVAASFEDFRRAAGEFARQLGPEDRFCLVKFDDRVELLLDWTRSELQLRRALRRLTPGVFTRFNDALALSAREQFPPNRRRHALVVLSDGVDSNRGASTHQDALRSLLESQVAVYVISNTEIERGRKRAELDSLLGAGGAAARFNELRIGGLRESLRVLDRSERELETLAGATGGRLYRPADFSALDAVYREIADELRRQYALYYTPADGTRDGRFRRVRVEVAGRPYRVSTRAGYFAPR